MDRPTFDAVGIILDALGAAVLAALERIGRDPEARFRCLRPLLAVAEEQTISRRLS
jgi:hypothetical protein